MQQRPVTAVLRAAIYHDAMAIIEAEYADDLCVDQIARRVATSRRQLQRAFTEVGATTFRHELAATRMQRAAELLSTRAMTVRDIAKRVGYDQPAQFAKAFRRYHGMTPSAFRAARVGRAMASVDGRRG